MKTIIIHMIAIAALTVFITSNSAGAGERLKVFEMGEGDFTVEFPMTSEEIAAEDDAYNQIIAASKKSVGNVSNRVKVFEMGEGGHVVEFRMTAAEITAANAENARLAAIKSASSGTVRHTGGKFELAESGYVIEFPTAGHEEELGDRMIAREKPSNNSVRAQ